MFFLLGPTAIGKTALAIEVALRCDAEIIGADAYQIYRGLDVLTAKPDAAQLARVPHHLISEIPGTQDFDAAHYRTLALARVAEIESRGRRVLIVGGTPLYIRALTRGLADLPPSDTSLRAELSKLPLTELRTRYAALDPTGYQHIDIQNPRRLVRAIEVSTLTGRPFSSLRDDWSASAAAEAPAPTPIPAIALTCERATLYPRIDARAEQMLAGGAIEEVRSAPTLSQTARQAIGVAEIGSLIRGEITHADCLHEIQQRTRRYAKRQLTWLRGERTISTIDLTRTPLDIAVEQIAQQLLAAPGTASAGSTGQSLPDV